MLSKSVDRQNPLTIPLTHIRPGMHISWSILKKKAAAFRHRIVLKDDSKPNPYVDTQYAPGLHHSSNDVESVTGSNLTLEVYPDRSRTYLWYKSHVAWQKIDRTVVGIYNIMVEDSTDKDFSDVVININHYLRL